VPCWTPLGLAGSVPRGDPVSPWSARFMRTSTIRRNGSDMCRCCSGVSRSLQSGSCRRLHFGVSDAAPIAVHGSNSKGGIAA
jgi:hypothetical protein